MRDKQTQIEREEIAEIIAQNFDLNGEKWDASDFEWAAHCVQMAGYRKASEVAREIFEELEKEIKLALEINKEEKDKLINSFFSFSLLRSLDSKIEVLQAASKFIAKLKKKYESEGEG